MARISPGRAWPLRMSRARRWVSTVVLPVPAPATTSRGPAMCSTASFWRGFNSKAGAEAGAAENKPSCEDETADLRPAGIDLRERFTLWWRQSAGAMGKAAVRTRHQPLRGDPLGAALRAPNFLCLFPGLTPWAKSCFAPAGWRIGNPHFLQQSRIFPVRRNPNLSYNPDLSYNFS